MTTATKHYETVIVGGGQAGLATGYHLRRRSRDCVILDAGERVGDAWRRRWPSLRLYSPAHLDGLPGMPFPGPARACPTAGEMADHLEAYAERFALPVRLGSRVDRVERDGNGYVVVAGDDVFQADNVVVATGVIQESCPLVPDFAAKLDPRIRQLHSADYHDPGQLADGRVLVVGASHSGIDIAYELARAGFPTMLSGRDTGELPFRLDGGPVRLLAPLVKLAVTRVISVSTPIGRKARGEIRHHGGPAIRIRADDLAAAGVDRVVERTVGAEGGKPVLADGRVLDVENVVWCTGFGRDYSWLRFPLPLDEDGYPQQDRGAATSLPGLYFVGMLFLHSFSSMLVLGAGRDGERVAKHIAARASRVEVTRGREAQPVGEGVAA
jgi:putative flavoprotein involved in K+ transport